VVGSRTHMPCLGMTVPAGVGAVSDGVEREQVWTRFGWIRSCQIAFSSPPIAMPTKFQHRATFLRVLLPPMPQPPVLPELTAPNLLVPTPPPRTPTLECSIIPFYTWARLHEVPTATSGPILLSAGLMYQDPLDLART